MNTLKSGESCYYNMNHSFVYIAGIKSGNKIIIELLSGYK